MKHICITKKKALFLCFYGGCIIAFYYIGYTVFDFNREPFTIWWVIFNFFLLLPYIIGANLVYFLGFSDKKRWLVNLVSVLSCCRIIYYLFHIKDSTGLEILVIPSLSVDYLIFMCIFTYVIYVIGRIFEIISDKWGPRK